MSGEHRGLAHARPVDRWAEVRRALRARGLRWTPQRRVLLDALARVDGHVTGAELVDELRAVDPTTTPSTVYRTLDVLEEIGVVSHSHGLEGREEFHVLPAEAHGHLVCSGCGRSWELTGAEARPFVDAIATGRGFQVALEHLSVEGVCEVCRSSEA